ncbi:hypothetical protein J4212_08155 [Candidatus Woesearchaeota archaeon]|nr:hypothetical protein [Candidatus Woesearchaeota archaeon]
MASEAFKLDRFIEILEQWGLTDVLLPFLLIFTLIFAVLEKTKILGEDQRNMNTGLAIIFALLVVIPHVTGDLPTGYDPVELINAALPSVSLLVVALVSLMILIGIFAHDKIYLGLTMPGWIGFFSVGGIILIFGGAAGWWGNGGFTQWLGDTFQDDALAVVVMLVVFGVIIAYVTGGSESSKKASNMQRLGINLKELFGGGGGHGGH